MTKPVCGVMKVNGEGASAPGPPDVSPNFSQGWVECGVGTHAQCHILFRLDILVAQTSARLQPVRSPVAWWAPSGHRPVFA
jgi:hypothetical protein